MHIIDVIELKGPSSVRVRQKKTRRWVETKACLCIGRLQRALAQISTSFNFKGLAHALAAARRAVRKHEECIVDAFELTKELLSSLAAQFNDHSYRATQAKACSPTVHAMRVAERKLERQRARALARQPCCELRGQFY